LLREFYPAALEAFAGDLASADAIAVLERAPTPQQGRSMSQGQLVSALRKAGRERNLVVKAAQIQACLRRPQLEAAARLTQAYGRSVTALVRLVRQLNQELASLEQELSASFECTRTPRSTSVCPDSAKSSAPGLWPNSATTELAFRILRRARTSPAPRRSRNRRANTRQCCAGSPAITGCLTPATSGPSPRSVARREPRTTTDGYELAATAISRRCPPSPTAWPASLTAAFPILRCPERR